MLGIHRIDIIPGHPNQGLSRRYPTSPFYQRYLEGGDMMNYGAWRTLFNRNHRLPLII
jgi:hypothetical protein